MPGGTDFSDQIVVEFVKNLVTKFDRICKKFFDFKVCTQELKPVCGSDGLTHANLCEFRKANCDDDSPELELYYTKGPCDDDDLPQVRPVEDWRSRVLKVRNTEDQGY